MYALRSLLEVSEPDDIADSYELALQLEVIIHSRFGPDAPSTKAAVLQTQICGEAVMMAAYKRGLSDHVSPRLE